MTTSADQDDVIYLPAFPLPQKPKYKVSACNGCGWCCHEEICKAGKYCLGVSEKNINNHIQGPCPFMDFVDGKVRCGLVLAEQASGMGNKIATALGIGTYCDASGLEVDAD